MGSPLGPLFTNLYMAHVENQVLSDPSVALSTYVRYVDDCFVDIRDVDHLLKLVREFESKSALKLTYELSRDGVLPFLMYWWKQAKTNITLAYTANQQTQDKL